VTTDHKKEKKQKGIKFNKKWTEGKQSNATLIISITWWVKYYLWVGFLCFFATHKWSSSAIFFFWNWSQLPTGGYLRRLFDPWLKYIFIVVAKSDITNNYWISRGFFRDF
jgi:hypothetical protein